LGIALTDIHPSTDENKFSGESLKGKEYKAQN
jgi:hypothetical protein